MTIKPTKIDRAGKHIPAPQPPDETEIQFSFKLLDLDSNRKFGLHHCHSSYWKKFLLRLKDVNAMKVREFRGTPSSQLRNHKISFKDTSEPAGFKQLPEQLRSAEAWQFELTQHVHGRVHGILINQTFFVVWLDPCHRLYDKTNTKCH